jgi:phage I-like protein
MGRAGYWVDLNGVQFDDGTNQTWIQAMPIGEYEHPFFGTIKITEKRTKRFAQNVNSNVRGTELDIDYDHKMFSGEAAGWIKTADARPDGLWVLVDWTQKAADAIRSKAYKYFSPEFDDSWTHPKTKQEFKDVLFGGGITNRPFLKDILPINMSEFFSHAAGDNQFTEGGKDMALTPEQLEKLRKKFALPDDADEATVITAMTADPEPVPEKEKGKEKEPVSAGEISAEIKKLSESNPAIKALVDLINVQGQQLSDNTKQLKEATVDTTIRQLTDRARAKNFAVPPATLEELKKTLMATDVTKELSEQIVKSFGSLIDLQVVELGERGGTRGGDQNHTASQRFTEEIAKLREADKSLDYSDAAVRVAATNPALYEEYQNESYAFRA